MFEHIGHAGEANIDLTYNLLRSMLQFVPAHRPTVGELLGDPAFLALGLVEDEIFVSPPFVPLEHEYFSVEEWMAKIADLIAAVTATAS